MLSTKLEAIRNRLSQPQRLLAISLFLGATSCAHNSALTQADPQREPPRIARPPANLMVEPKPSGSYWSELTALRNDAQAMLKASQTRSVGSNATQTK